MVTTLFYPVYLALAFGLTLILIPRKKYKEFFIYGLLIGGLGDIVVVVLFQNILHIIKFKNAGIFDIMGLNYLSPPSWLCTVMLFLYFLPHRRIFLYLYVFTFAFLVMDMASWCITLNSLTIGTGSIPSLVLSPFLAGGVLPHGFLSKQVLWPNQIHHHE